MCDQRRKIESSYGRLETPSGDTTVSAKSSVPFVALAGNEIGVETIAFGAPAGSGVSSVNASVAMRTECSPSSSSVNEIVTVSWYAPSALFVIDEGTSTNVITGGALAGWLHVMQTIFSTRFVAGPDEHARRAHETSAKIAMRMANLSLHG
jgi:hypothetical protein